MKLERSHSPEPRRGSLYVRSHESDNPHTKPKEVEIPENDNENGGSLTGADTPPLGQKKHDLNDFKKEAAPSGKETPVKNVALDTVEDLVLSWTTLSRDMIQL